MLLAALLVVVPLFLAPVGVRLAELATDAAVAHRLAQRHVILAGPAAHVAFIAAIALASLAIHDGFTRALWLLWAAVTLASVLDDLRHNFAALRRTVEEPADGVSFAA